MYQELLMRNLAFIIPKTCQTEPCYLTAYTRTSILLLHKSTQLSYSYSLIDILKSNFAVTILGMVLFENNDDLMMFVYLLSL